MLWWTNVLPRHTRGGRSLANCVEQCSCQVRRHVEMGCQPENPSDKSLFEKNTRAASKSLMVYTASIDSAWSALPNHERITDDSFHVLQVLCSSIGPLSIARSIATRVGR